MRLTVLVLLMSVLALAGAKKYCGSSYQSLKDRTCTFAQQTTPCVGPNEPSVRQKCCDKGCGITEIQSACCFTDACLARCYPNRNQRERKQHLGTVQ